MSKSAFFIGATIHDVAQVVGAGYAVSDEAGDIATYVKLLRVACLPVVVIGLAFAFRKSEDGEAKAPFPWFAVGFAAILVANSFGLIPELVRASMGLGVAVVSDCRDRGARHENVPEGDGLPWTSGISG